MLNWFTPERQTWLFRVNPALKFVVFFTFMIITLINQNLQFALWQTILYGLLFYVFSGYSLKKLAVLSIPLVISFLSTGLTMLLFGKGESVLWQFGIFKISEESIQHALLLGSKSLSFGLVGFTFILTIQPILFFYAMMQQFRMPSKYAYSFIAAFRLIPAVTEELQIRRNALKVRNVQFSRGSKGLYERLQSYTVPLFAQSIRRAQRIAVAMEAKQYQMGAARTYFYPTRYTHMDVVFVAVMILGFAVTLFLSSSGLLTPR
ncbi:energy-coupling factor transporter transmembrane protein EcfT [Sporosarcina sp. P26b]|uniref:energy-coupling factor transporter transmembrane component T family protein n=1 Tax=Sporosarcina TaxID=1569 RepID=UPI000A17FB7D|nr:MULTISPECIES: energy-coupling factor transporter transmembrane component T [Sporosarcina]ARK21283.1 ABC transporter permease [Sporosarcina ureae]PIC73416.1 energy-coupling factor transporter transmembrane protein EcfT [Sporosarcina sp. P17b]PIC95454.1 energy-coupling factor transporter transmembrane protein EcfT [Sporosarcina sp. P26b]